MLQAGGLLGGAFPWSFRSRGVSAASESATAGYWDSAIQAMWGTSALAALIPTTTTLTYTSCSTASPTWTQTTKTTANHNIPGTGTAASLPFQCSEIVTFRTAHANKAGRGRWYLPALSTAALAATGDVLSAAALSAVQGACQAFWTTLGGNITLQIVHMHATKSGDAQYSMTPVVASDCSAKIGIQRRRGDKLAPTRLTITL
jgi:hypothetical protein